jgi:hypothetical protein
MRVRDAVIAVVVGITSVALGASDEPSRSAAHGPEGAATIDALAIPAGSDPIKIDGDLSEDVWTRTQAITEFQQRDPDEGAAPTHATDVRVVFDATSLYVAIRALDAEPDRVAGLLTRRDETSPSDWVSILIDSYHDKRTAYEFGVNPAGVKYDRYWFNDTNNDRSWDAVWDVAAAQSPEGWRAEFRIPFSQLRFKAGDSGAIGFAVVRTVAHANEISTWPLLARSASGYVSSFGALRGVVRNGVQKKLELMPYAVGQITTAPVASNNPLTSSPDPDASVGVDLKYQVAPGFTLTGTINPDFGQVEADPAVVNLGAFETFFAERRPFFVEGSGNFSFNVDCNDGSCTGLFYSRRIGRQPRGFVSAPDGGFAAQPSNSTIFGAAKLTGRAGAFSIGVLNAVTAQEDASVIGTLGGPVDKSAVEPATSYSVARASREFANNSRLSFMLTSTNRRLNEDLRFIPGAAVTGGLDGDWRLAKGKYSIAGYWAGSTVRGSADAIDRIQRGNVHSFQRPDATHLDYDPTRTSLNGHAGAVNVNKISGQSTRFSSNFSYKSPGFEINDLGFLSRADELSMSNWYQWRNDRPAKYVRNLRVNFNQWAGWNVDGDRRFSGINVNAHWVFMNNWSVGSGFNVNTRGFSDRLTRGGPGGYVNGNLNQWGYFNTDSRRALSAGMDLSWFNDRRGSSGWSASPFTTWRPTPALQVSTSLNVNANVADSQWVENLETSIGPRYVFGRIDQTTVGVSARVNYTIRPNLTLQIYARPYVSAGVYSNFKTLAAGRAAQYDDRYTPFAYASNPDFNYLSFRTTNVLRWEYRPGSALFVVWQQGREDVTARGDFRFGRDVGDAFAAPSTNVLLVKFSRWLNF